MNKRKINRLTVFAVLIVLLMTSCLPGGGHYDGNTPAGFFSGVWHGWVAPISLVLSIFNDSRSIYETYNTGWWYDFGFYISIISGFGSIQLFRKKKGN
ncbi:hypothetical protein SAMN06265379_103263 [Saccharicrinis carchari]|uniref:Lipoprotein n=1 Tax=Saccharicrinis carchari TaxID=1168039 RepID=A0A521CNN3_SACCC|nr:hypothetical protein [Saccharicrinis carchari]SMO60280.1 hypothetical protein SAMN06265379_103263 [Saccharicrinis carchari]